MNKNYIYIIFSCIILQACNPFISPEVRQANRANRKLEKILKKYPQLLKTDTITQEIAIEVPAISGQANIPLNNDYTQLSGIIDSLLKTTGINNTKPIINTIIERIKERPILLKDTVTKTIDGITFKWYINANGTLCTSYYKPPQEIKKNVSATVKTVQRIQIPWYKKIISYLNNLSGILVLLIAAWVILPKFVQKIITYAKFAAGNRK